MLLRLAILRNNITRSFCADDGHRRRGKTARKPYRTAINRSCQGIKISIPYDSAVPTTYNIVIHR